MSVGDILRLFMIVTGLVLLWTTVSSLAKHKMTENVCLAWGLIAVICILAGLLLRPYGINSYISRTGLVLIILGTVIVLQGAVFVSKKVSELVRRNHELALQVSLLNHENYNMLQRMEQLENKLAEKEENNRQ